VPMSMVCRRVGGWHSVGWATDLTPQPRPAENDIGDVLASNFAAAL